MAGHRHDVIVIGGSAGGIEASQNLLAGLPADLPAAVFVVIHISPFSQTTLPKVLARRAGLPADYAKAGEVVRPGRVYVAPPDQHLQLVDGQIRLTRGPRENNARPSVDVLFRSAARNYGPRVVGVVLSGSLWDGSTGLLMVKRAGGVAITQDPGEATFPEMPESAIERVPVDYILPVARIAQVLVSLAQEAVSETAMAEQIDSEQDDIKRDLAAEEAGGVNGRRSMFSCPNCGGALWEWQDGDLVRFRCHVGHGYTSDALLEQQVESLELALWSAVRALEETASLARAIASRMESRNGEAAAARYRARADEAERRAEILRRLIESPALARSEIMSERGGPEQES